MAEIQKANELKQFLLELDFKPEILEKFKIINTLLGEF